MFQQKSKHLIILFHIFKKLFFFKFPISDTSANAKK